MSAALESSSPEPNVTQAVPFLRVTDMRASLRFYLDGLGFRLKVKWTPETPDQIRWCWLEIGSAALMLQEYAADAGHSARVPQPFGQARASASCARTRSRSIAMRSRKA